MFQIHPRRALSIAALSLAASIPLLSATSADAFCGFYVGGAGAELFADATQVVLMRDGTKTVLSMQNRYSGPAEGFAMIIPVPQVLMQEDVKTLYPELFAKIDTLTSPRLVEYWEQDPCLVDDYYNERGGGFFPPSATADDADGNVQDPGVVVEAEFAVGEYDIQILSSNNATALDTWLVDEGYNVPTGAAPYYQPYIEGGMYFFAAKVDPERVTFGDDGSVILSPLRFAYDSDDFQLPIRLGMINSAGKQDLLVYILGDQQRYELANYPNAFVPTNIEVVDDVRNDFAGFYRNLFDRTLEENPGSAITEYSWAAGTCDPCPGPVTLDPSDIETLGGDVLTAQNPSFNSWNMVITRLHMRYGKDEIGEDLVFAEAEPVVGGRERYDAEGNIEKNATPDSINNFQARFIIRHRWEGPVVCLDPVFERWGGDPNGGGGGPSVTASPSPNTTGGAVFNDADGAATPLEQQVLEDIPEIDVVAQYTPPDDELAKCGCSTTGQEGAATAGLATLAMLGLLTLRRRRR